MAQRELATEVFLDSLTEQSSAPWRTSYTLEFLEPSALCGSCGELTGEEGVVTYVWMSQCRMISGGGHTWLFPLMSLGPPRAVL